MLGRIAAIAGSVVADAVRRKVVYVVLVFAAIMAAAIPSLPSYGIGVIGPVFREVALALMWVGGLVVTLTLAAVRVPGEVERRTVYNVLAKRVRRWEYLVGTWLGIVSVVGGIIVCFNVVNQIVAWTAYGQPMWRLWEGVLAIWLEMGVIAALAVAVSAAVGPVVVVVAALAFLFIAHSRPPGLETGLAGALYPSLDVFNVIIPVAHGGGYGPVYAAGMAAVFLGWVAGLLLAGSLAFSRRDL